MRGKWEIVTNSWGQGRSSEERFTRGHIPRVKPKPYQEISIHRQYLFSDMTAMLLPLGQNRRWHTAVRRAGTQAGTCIQSLCELYSQSETDADFPASAATKEQSRTQWRYPSPPASAALRPPERPLWRRFQDWAQGCTTGSWAHSSRLPSCGPQTGGRPCCGQISLRSNTISPIVGSNEQMNHQQNKARNRET